MKRKTCIVLSTLAFGLRALALIAVLLMTVLQEPVKRLYNTDPEVVAIHTVPWTEIIAALVWLILAGVILMVLLMRPRRGGTIALTVVMAALFVVFALVLSPALTMIFSMAISKQGYMKYTAYIALSNAIGMVINYMTVPSYILSLLALGGACGKDFRTEQ